MDEIRKGKQAGRCLARPGHGRGGRLDRVRGEVEWDVVQLDPRLPRLGVLAVASGTVKNARTSVKRTVCGFVRPGAGTDRTSQPVPSASSSATCTGICICHHADSLSVESSPTKMPPSLLHPPGQLSPADALHLSQRAPEVLRSSPSSFSPWSLASLWASSESPELWINYENLLLSCLRTGDEQAAHECLERLAKRFGDDNERIMAFKGLLQEADAENDAALERVLEGYNQLLSDKNTNIVSCQPRDLWPTESSHS